MASKEAHLALANRNQAVLEYLLQQPDCCAEWIVTVAFYKALHLVEALFAHDGKGHGHSHEQRDRMLKGEPRYRHIYKHYRPLWAASVVARYLENPWGDSFRSFADYLSPQDVQQKMVGHHLRQIERSVERLLQ